ncbi:hypothetical protein JCM19235_3009 [Vibrio maritimus]|uniref:Uncharacterized protein n=1 Tax=Vibrio maritimus TaxID=990268 RepID=A0A090S711_9VIBR|nr:hypothetical protein JCM19235_3009 [Vibrio maritimus]
MAIAPNQEHAVMFARRPGSYAMVFNYVSGDIETLIPAIANAISMGMVCTRTTVVGFTPLKGSVRQVLE